MSDNTTYTKPIKSPFDILNAQVGSAQNASDPQDEFKIPIKKVFDNLPKPTELEPIPVVARTGDTAGSTSTVHFKAPRESLDFLDELIIKNKRPLKALRFDVSESSSKDEIVKFINQTSLLIQVEKNKLIELLGGEHTVKPVVGGNPALPNDPLLPTEPAVVLPEIVHPEKTLPMVQEVTMDEARRDYTDLLAPYLRKINIDKKNFEKLMAEFGVNKKMPKKDEPLDLVRAKEEYLNTKNAKIKNIAPESSLLEFNLGETSDFREELISKLDPKISKFSVRAGQLWDKAPSSANDQSTSFLLEDVEFAITTKLPEEVKFEGLRNTEPYVPQEVKQVQPVAQVVAPVTVEKAVPKPEPQVLPQVDVQKTVEPEQQPQKVEQKAQIFEEPVLRPVIQTPIMEEFPESAENKAVENSTLQKEMLIAESLNSNIETFPSEFEGKSIVVTRGEAGNSNAVKVEFDGKEIAKGEIKKNGPKIKIKPEFKASWFHVKTLEQRAFDEKVFPFLKTFKYNT